MHSDAARRRPANNLRCRLCGRTLVSGPVDIVPHKPGPGQVAFEPRKRDPRWAIVPAQMRAPGPAPTPLPASSGADEASAAGEPQAESSGAPVSSATQSSSAASEDAAEEAVPQPGPPAPPAQTGPSPIQTAAALTSRLPPHLAALRLGRAGASPAPAAGPTSGTHARSHSSAPPAACSSHFIEPQPWMSAFLDAGEVRGRIQCPNGRCAGKLGSWDWAGAQCACGAWITPAFALHASRVDAV